MPENQSSAGHMSNFILFWHRY